MEDKIREWLDALVDVFNKQKELMVFNAEIQIGDQYQYYLMKSGINIVADAMGIPLSHEKTNNKRWPHEYSFFYKGIGFHQYEEQPLENINDD